MSVYIDVTEFLERPLASGIQRVTAEICRKWPDAFLVPVKFEQDRVVVLDRRTIGAIADHFCGVGKAMPQYSQSPGEAPLHLGEEDVLLVPELFYDFGRIAYYRGLSAEDLRRCRFILYDLIPLEYPEFFPHTQFDLICAYFQMIRQVPWCGFISEATQRAYCYRLLRRRELSGAVFRLGSDGLSAPPSAAARCSSLTFTVVGRIENRKNPALILEAFEPLLREIAGLQLVFLGKLGQVAPQFAEKFERMTADPASGVLHHPDVNDEAICKYVDASRATVFVSCAEGFGLPPVESLWRGTPVIASPRIPSLETIGSCGVHLVDPLTSEQLRAAVRAFLDDGYAMRKAEEASQLQLPTWQGFVDQLAAWCTPERTVKMARSQTAGPKAAS